jgi:hypothetical protein
MPKDADHGHDHQPEHEADAERSARFVIDGVGDDRAADGEDERERGQGLGGGAPPECRRGVRTRNATRLTNIASIGICK